MKKTFKIISVLVLIPLVFAITFCCCLGENANAFAESVATQQHQGLEKSHHSENQHHHSKGKDDCFCPKHFSFLSEQPFEIVPNSSSFQLFAKDFLVVFQFEGALLFSPLHAQGPPRQDHRDQTSIPLFIEQSNLRI